MKSGYTTKHTHLKYCKETCPKNASVTHCIDAIKCYGHRVIGVTDNKILGLFLWELQPMVQNKILKDNPTILSDACIMAKIISWLDGYFGQVHP